MKKKTKTLGDIHDECTETECKLRGNKTSCCATLLFGGSHFTDGKDDCLKRAKNPLNASQTGVEESAVDELKRYRSEYAEQGNDESNCVDNSRSEQ
jgi:hypothetical protein